MSNFKCPTFNSMERWKLYGELTRQVELYKTKIEETSSIDFLDRNTNDSIKGDK